jgi:hypothetical protein
MPSDAAKKKAAQKKAAAVTKRAPAGKKDAAETESQSGAHENEPKSSNSSSAGPASSESEPPRSGVSTGSVPGKVAQTKSGVASNATERGAANVSRVVFPPTLSARQRALIHGGSHSCHYRRYHGQEQQRNTHNINCTVPTSIRTPSFLLVVFIC